MPSVPYRDEHTSYRYSIILDTISSPKYPDVHLLGARSNSGTDSLSLIVTGRDSRRIPIHIAEIASTTTTYPPFRQLSLLHAQTTPSSLWELTQTAYSVSQSHVLSVCSLLPNRRSGDPRPLLDNALCTEPRKEEPFGACRSIAFEVPR